MSRNVDHSRVLRLCLKGNDALHAARRRREFNRRAELVSCRLQSISNARGKIKLQTATSQPAEPSAQPELWKPRGINLIDLNRAMH